jgi:hypothetical protein
MELAKEWVEFQESSFLAHEQRMQRIASRPSPQPLARDLPFAAWLVRTKLKPGDSATCAVKPTTATSSGTSSLDEADPELAVEAAIKYQKKKNNKNWIGNPITLTRKPFY